MDWAYYEDIKLHEKGRSRGYHLTEKEIIDFAKVWEPRLYHADHEFASKTKFGSVIATGNHLISIAYRLNYELSCEKNPATAYIVSPGLDEIRFITPARPGDILVAETKAISKRPSKSDPHAGIVRYAWTLLNQRDELVLSLKLIAIVEKRPQQ
jgi:acyl dehydratase